MAELERTGESLVAFAKREGLSAERLYRWRARLGKAAFVEVGLATGRPAGDGVLEVVLASGRAVRVPADFNEVALRRLIALLEGGGC